MNQTVLKALRSLAQPLSAYDQWASLVPFVQYQINTSCHNSLGTSPFALVFGRVNQAAPPALEDIRNDLARTLDLGKLTPSQYAQELSGWLKAAADTAAHHQELTNERRLTQLNHGRKGQSLDPGQLVLLIAPFCLDKLAPRLLGPFEVVGPVGSTGVLLENIEDHKRVTAPIRNVRAFHNPGLSQDELIDLAGRDKLEQLVEAILDHKRERLGTYYLVRWFGDSVPTWEPEYVVRDLAVLDDYLKQ